LIPFKDNIPTSRFPIVTVLLIAANIAAFVWQLTVPGDEYASPQTRELGLSERDQDAVEFGAIPFRLMHPGAECAVGVTPRAGTMSRAAVVCEDTPEYRDAERLSDNGAAPLVPMDAPGWWATVFTSMFMHAGLLHLGGNMLFLWVFGNNVEDSMGRLRFLLFYLLAGIVAVYSEALLAPSSTLPTIGASGAVSGVLGGYILLYPRARILTMIIIIFFFTFIEIPALIMLGIWFALQALPAFADLATPDLGDGAGGVAYLAHVGGFIFGLATIKLFAKRHRSGEATLATGY
jgi:membrane associated rhomboid family serine protease